MNIAIASSFANHDVVIVFVRDIVDEEELLFAESAINLELSFQIPVNAGEDCFNWGQSIVVVVLVLGSRLKVIKDDAPLSMFWHL